MGSAAENVATTQEILLTIETEREADGRWLADIPALPGVMAYGKTKPEAIRAVRALALRVLADDIEDEALPFDVVRFVQQ